MNFFRQVLHKIRVGLWFFVGKKTSLDFLGESFVSISARWHGELYPVLSYIPMFDVLRQNRFSGEFLEFGGGYSTVLALNMFDLSKVRIKSVDLNPSKYNRILNSVDSRKKFLSMIDNVEKPTVSLNEALEGLEKLRLKFAKFDRQDVKNAIRKYVNDSESISSNIADLIFSADGKDLKRLIMGHAGYVNDLKFYRSANYESGSGFCSTLVESGYVADAVFFDCGEISSLGEWSIMEDAIKVGGYALFHDVFYPKSIKNFLIATYVELSGNWKLIYRDTISPQGGVVAVRVC